MLPGGGGTDLRPDAQTARQHPRGADRRELSSFRLKSKFPWAFVCRIVHANFGLSFECWLGFWQVRNQLRAEQIARNIREKELREKQKQEEAAAGDEDAAAAAALGIEEPAPPPDPLA